MMSEHSGFRGVDPLIRGGGLPCIVMTSVVLYSREAVYFMNVFPVVRALKACLLNHSLSKKALKKCQTSNFSPFFSFLDVLQNLKTRIHVTF